MRINLYRTNNPKVVGTFFIVFSVIFIIIGICAACAPKMKSKKCTETVMAEVIDLLPVKSSSKSGRGHNRTSITYRPVFSYTYNGKDYRAESSTSSDPPAFQVGETVKLKIDPNNPKNFYAPSDKTYGLLGIIFSAMGGIFLLIGILLVALAVKADKKERVLNDENI